MTDATTTTQPALRTALRVENACLIDGTGAHPVHGAVVITDNRGTLTYAGPAGAAPRRPHDASGVRVIDAGGRSVLPGFFDCHTHLAFAQGSSPGRRGELDPVLLTYDTSARLRQTLEAGVTTARDVGAQRSHPRGRDR